MVGRMKSGPVAKERLLVILGNLAGVVPVAEACRKLGVGRTLFRRMRKVLLLAGLRAVEPRPRGRPVREVPRHERVIAQLRVQVTRLEEDLRFARIREELALLVPWTARRQKKMRRLRWSRPAAPPSKPQDRSAPAASPGPSSLGDSA
jgi:hypothetical protein